MSNITAARAARLPIVVLTGLVALLLTLSLAGLNVAQAAPSAPNAQSKASGSELSLGGTATKKAKPGSTYWAVVDADGTLARGRGAVSASKVDVPDGAYEVLFSRKIRKCAYVATIGSSADSGTEPTGQISTVGRVGKKTGVFVDIWDSTGSARTDRGFHLAVHC